jgi:DNA-binding transcriptional ArsR family regulator
MGEIHGVTSQTRVDAESAAQVAALMTGLAAASRVQILGRLREGACSVTELCAAVVMTQPAVSQQLRILRSLSLVVGNRSGRQTIYALHDPHVAVLLDEALRHLEHLHDQAAATPRFPAASSTPPTNGAP